MTIDEKIESLTCWIAHLVEWRKELSDQLSVLQIQESELKLSIQNIDQGCEYWQGTAVIGAPLAALIKMHYRPTWDGPRGPWSAGHGSLPVAQRLLESLQREREDLQ